MWFFGLKFLIGFITTYAKIFLDLVSQKCDFPPGAKRYIHIFHVNLGNQSATSADVAFWLAKYAYLLMQGISA